MRPCQLITKKWPVLHLEFHSKELKTSFSHTRKRCPESSEITFNYTMTIPDRPRACQTFSVICGEPMSWKHVHTRKASQVLAALPTESYQLLGDMGMRYEIWPWGILLGNKNLKDSKVDLATFKLDECINYKIKPRGIYVEKVNLEKLG